MGMFVLDTGMSWVLLVEDAVALVGVGVWGVVVLLLKVALLVEEVVFAVLLEATEVAVFLLLVESELFSPPVLLATGVVEAVWKEGLTVCASC